MLAFSNKPNKSYLSCDRACMTHAQGCYIIPPLLDFPRCPALDAATIWHCLYHNSFAANEPQ